MPWATLQRQLSFTSIFILALAASVQSGPVGEQHPDLQGLLALKASICSRPQGCDEVKTWSADSNLCTWEGVFCAYIAGSWRAVSIHLQLDANAVLLNDSALEFEGVVPQVPYLRELELMCISPKHPVGPTPANVQDMLSGIPHHQAAASLQYAQVFGVTAEPVAASTVGSFSSSSEAMPLAPTDALVADVVTSRNNSCSDTQSTAALSAMSVISDRSSSSSSSSSSLGSAGVQFANLVAAAAAPGELPTRWFQAYPRLSTLRVVGCGVNGTLPMALTAAKQLKSLVLSHNRLTGSLPKTLVQLQGLMLLDLSHNAFSGTLPRHWASLNQLSYLYLNANNITLDELPCEWSLGMPSLKLADLSSNTGKPAAFAGTTATGCAVARKHAAAVTAVARPAYNVSKPNASRMLLVGVLNRSRRAAALGFSNSSISRQQRGSTVGGGSAVSNSKGRSLFAPRCWLRRFCYQEGAFICLQRSPRHPAGGCTSYVYGASDLHIDPLNQCDHGGTHLIAILCLWIALFMALLLIWLNHCRLLRWMVEPQPDQPPQPWQQPYQRQWLVTGPPPTATSSSREQTLPLLYNQPRTRDDAAGFNRPPSPLSAGLGTGTLSPIGSIKSESLPSALVTPPATSSGPRYMLVRGFGLTTAFSSGHEGSDSGSGRTSRGHSDRMSPMMGLGRRDSSSSSSCFNPSLMLPLVMLLLDVITDVRLVLLWGLSPHHYKLWPSYVLLGFVCVPHVLVGAVVNFRLVAAACLPPAIEAASPALVADILPPGGLLVKRLYGKLFAAPWFVAYPLLLVLVGPMTALLTVLCPLTLLVHAVGFGTHESVVRYLQLVQGCAALTEAPGSAVLLTALFLMGNLPLEWAFLDSALYYLNVVASMADMAVAWWIKLAGIRHQQLIELASPSADHW